jgi:mono/diheme cytochrome c family protein
MNRLAVLVLASFALAAPAFAQAGKTPGDAAKGEAMARRWCAACHLLEGQGRASDAAPAFATIARDPRKTDDYLRTFLARPHAPMPPLQLSRGEIEDIVAYFDALRGR